MSNVLPINVVLTGALPVGTRTTPQELAELIAERLELQSTQSFALFVSGSTEPSSNDGPWLKNDTTWYVWSDSEGRYVPATIDLDSIPNGTITYGKLNLADGSIPYAKILVANGEIPWAKVLVADGEIPFVKVNVPNGSITAAMIAPGVIPSSFNDYLALAGMSASQTITAGAARAKVDFDTATYDPTSRINTADNRYVAAVNGWYEVNVNLQVDFNSGAGTGIQMIIEIRRGGAATLFERLERETDEIGAQSLAFIAPIYIGAGDYIETWFEINDTGGSVWNLGPVNTFMTCRLLRAT